MFYDQARAIKRQCTSPWLKSADLIEFKLLEGQNDVEHMLHEGGADDTHLLLLKEVVKTTVNSNNSKIRGSVDKVAVNQVVSSTSKRVLSAKTPQKSIEMVQVTKQLSKRRKTATAANDYMDDNLDEPAYQSPSPKKKGTATTQPKDDEKASTYTREELDEALSSQAASFQKKLDAFIHAQSKQKKTPSKKDLPKPSQEAFNSPSSESSGHSSTNSRRAKQREVKKTSGKILGRRQHNQLSNKRAKAGGNRVSKRDVHEILSSSPSSEDSSQTSEASYSNTRVHDKKRKYTNVKKEATSDEREKRASARNKREKKSFTRDEREKKGSVRERKTSEPSKRAYASPSSDASTSSPEMKEPNKRKRRDYRQEANTGEPRHAVAIENKFHSASSMVYKRRKSRQSTTKAQYSGSFQPEYLTNITALHARDDNIMERQMEMNRLERQMRAQMLERSHIFGLYKPK